MEVFVYILYSSSKDRFYIGSTKDLARRLEIHNSGGYKDSSTHYTSDWEIYYSLLCKSRSQAIQIEKHIKRMRNRVYFKNLKQYPEIGARLLKKYE